MSTPVSLSLAEATLLVARIGQMWESVGLDPTKPFREQVNPLGTTVIRYEQIILALEREKQLYLKLDRAADYLRRHEDPGYRSPYPVLLSATYVREIVDHESRFAPAIGESILKRLRLI